MYDLVIIGGGPAGVAAGVYAARKKIKVALVAESFGGQSLVSADVQNWIGTKSISGLDLGKALEEHVRAQEGIEIVDGELVQSVVNASDHLILETSTGKRLETKFLLVASGSRRRKLGVPGEAELDGRGVAYCSICDAPLFKDKVVAVVGGGNAGLEAVTDLLPYASKIILLERTSSLRGDAVSQEKIKSSPKVEVILEAETKSISGKDFVDGLVYTDLKTGEEKRLELQGVFIEIGALPNSDMAKSVVKLNGLNEIIADPKTQQTSHSRIWAVGDVADGLYKQNNISAGDAIKAVLNIYDRIIKS